MISIDPPTQDAASLWRKVLELSERFGEDEDWCLIGGLMVQLHAYEHHSDSRPTRDIDVLANARARPSMTERLASVLDDLGARIATPPRTSPRTGYKFELDGEEIEILGPDGLAKDPKTLGTYETIQVDGGTQALKRTEKVSVSVAGSPAKTVRRPTLLGAILLKARALSRVRDRLEEHRQDLIRLLSLVPDPRGLAQSDGLTAAERGWLRRVDADLAWESPEVTELFNEAELVRARQAYALLAL